MTPKDFAMKIFLDIQRCNDYPPSTNISFEAIKRSAYVAAELLLYHDMKRWFSGKRTKYWDEVKVEIRKIKP